MGQGGSALIRTFIDAGVLISAVIGRDALFEGAWDILDDPERVFLTSEFVRLEVFPKALYFHHQEEADWYAMFFTAIAEMVPLSEAFMTQLFRFPALPQLRMVSLARYPGVWFHQP
jgi:hypothetical protein